MTPKTPTTPASTDARPVTSGAVRHPVMPRLAAWLGCSMLLGTMGCASRYEATKLGNLVVHTITHEHANMHVVVEDGHAFAVDTGLQSTAADMALDLKTLGIPPESLRAIVVSHGHHDHAGGARFFQKTYGTKIVAGRGDLSMMARGKNDPICPVGFLARSRYATDSTQSYEPVVPDVVVDGRVSLFALTGVHAEVVPVASHTPGSLTVIAGQAALVGDLFRGGLVGAGAEVHFYMCDLPNNRRQIQSLLAHEAVGATTFFPGHFGPVTREEVIARFVESEP